MKIIFKKKTGMLLLLAALIVATGCSEKATLPETEETPGEETELATAKTPAGEPEAELPKDTPAVEEPVTILPCDTVTPAPDNILLAGTAWRLAGFVNIKTGELKIPEPLRTDTTNRPYVLRFETNACISGRASSNDLTGTYAVDSSSGTVDIHGGTKTYINEYPEGYRFLNAVKGVHPYELLEDELRIFENEEFYLQFKPYLK